jgi:mannose-1-phosphate guanylyltransferase
MQALILVGGEATRLRPLTCNMPKSMVPVLNTPFLEHVIRYLVGHGVRDIVLAQGHLSTPMEDYFGDGSRFGIKLTNVVESQPMGTAGAVKNAEQHLDSSFLVLNGDIFTDLDLTAMQEFHEGRQAMITIALTPVEDPTAYGLIETGSGGRITRFLEKPSWNQITTNMINAGTYILSKEILKRIPAGANYSFERQLFPQLLETGDPLFAFPSNAYWMDIGTPEKYLKLHRDLMRGEVKGYQVVQGKVVKIGQACTISTETQIVGPAVIGNNCVISRGVKIFGPTVLGNGSYLGEDSVVDSSIIWANTRLGSKVTLNESLLANDCQLENGVTAEKTVIGDHVVISRSSRLGAGSRIWPTAPVIPVVTGKR